MLLYVHRDPVLLYVHRDHTDYYGQGAQDNHLNFHTAPELCNVLYTPHYLTVGKTSPQYKMPIASK